MPPSDSQVSRANWYLPRYWPSGETAVGSPPDSHWAMRASSALGAEELDSVALSLSVVAAFALLRPSAASVCGPTTPSTVRPLRFWKRLIARRVCGPATPSAVMPSLRWTALTS